MNPKDQAATQRVVLAGKKIMFDPKTFPILMKGIKGDMPMPDKLATEAVGLMKMLQDKANGSIPIQVLLPAAAMLMLEIAKFMRDSKQGDPTPEDIKAAYPKLVALLQKVFSNAGAAPPGQTAAPSPQPVAAAPAPGLMGAA
ncbi:MAG: hypothetical protein Q8R92_16970 [Deltaproteobacteria bacterium]|nr:hypothetical protein [Deltaproteobacteria bacterium]